MYMSTKREVRRADLHSHVIVTLCNNTRIYTEGHSNVFQDRLVESQFKFESFGEDDKSFKTESPSITCP